MGEDVDAIKTTIADTKEKLKKIENKKGSVSASIYKKVKDDYEKRLKDLNAQLAGKKESLKESLKEIATKRQPLKSKLDDLQEQLEEIELRHSIGEYTDGQYKSMSNEIKEKMDLIEGDLEAIKKEEKETKELLGEHEEEDLLVDEKIEEIEETEEDEKVEEEEKEIESEPLPEVSEENMIAEELFTGKEITAEESENVVSNVSAANAEKDVLIEQQKEQASGEELFDFSEEESSETEKKETKKPSAVSDEEDWLSSLEQELNEETEEGKKEETEEKETETANKNSGDELFSVCPKCNYKNRPDAWYCENCGSELASPE
jgi:ribosomal protein L40E